jgi:hypothetical protein
LIKHNNGEKMSAGFGDAIKSKQLLVLAFAVASLTLSAMCYIGLNSSSPMIGDEIAHYYQLVTQSEKLPGVSFGWSLITAAGKERSGLGPHVPGWHYLGSLLYKIFPGFMTVQFYHLIFWILLMTFSYLTVRHLYHNILADSALLVLMATFPAFVLFGLAFYQDLPATALIVTAFYLIFKRYYFPGVLLIGLAFFFKENSVLMLPGACFLIFAQERKLPLRHSVWIMTAIFLVCLFIALFDVLVFYYFGGKTHNILVEKLLNTLKDLQFISDNRVSAPQGEALPIAYPGDIRVPANWIIYPGGIIWLAVCAGLGSFWSQLRSGKLNHPAFLCLVIALCYLIPTYILGRASPDIRYFLPGIPFLIFALVWWLSRYKYCKLLLITLAIIGSLQTGAVCYKLYTMRMLGSDFESVVKVLENRKTDISNKNNKIFMYAEKWRFLPYEPQWTISTEVWKKQTDRDVYDLLKINNIAFIGIDKSKVSPIGSSAVDVRIYPTTFIALLNSSQLFIKLCDNSQYTVYELKKNAQ